MQIADNAIISGVETYPAKFRQVSFHGRADQVADAGVFAAGNPPEVFSDFRRQSHRDLDLRGFQYDRVLKIKMFQRVADDLTHRLRFVVAHRLTEPVEELYFQLDRKRAGGLIRLAKLLPLVARTKARVNPSTPMRSAETTGGSSWNPSLEKGPASGYGFRRNQP